MTVDDTRDHSDSWPSKAWHRLAFRLMDIISWALAPVTNVDSQNSALRGDVSPCWLRATTAMLKTLIYTWISQYRSTGVKCAFLYILLIVFSLDSVRCFKVPGLLRRQLEELFAMIMSVCVFGFHVITCMCVRECVSHFHRDTLDGHSEGQSLLWDALDDPTSKNMALLYGSGF